MALGETRSTRSLLRKPPDIGHWVLGGVAFCALLALIILRMPRIVSMGDGTGAAGLLCPVGGEQWHVGTTKHILLTKPSLAVLQISRDNGATWAELVDLSIHPVRVYPWRVTGPPSSECTIRVVNVAIGSHHASRAFEILAQPTAGRKGGAAAIHTPRHKAE